MSDKGIQEFILGLRKISGRPNLSYRELRAIADHLYNEDGTLSIAQQNNLLPDTLQSPTLPGGLKESELIASIEIKKLQTIKEERDKQRIIDNSAELFCFS